MERDTILNYTPDMSKYVGKMNPKKTSPKQPITAREGMDMQMTAEGALGNTMPTSSGPTAQPADLSTTSKVDGFGRTTM